MAALMVAGYSLGGTVGYAQAATRPPQRMGGSCHIANHPARVISGTRSRETDVDFLAGRATVLILVEVSSTGLALRTRVLSPQRTPSELNLAAEHLARLARYSPKLVNCRPVVSTVQYTVTFWTFEPP